MGETEEHEFGVMSPPVARLYSSSVKSLSGEQVKEALKHVASLAVENRRLALELQGARIFTEEELDKLVQGEDVGLRLLSEHKEVRGVERLDRSRMVDQLSKCAQRELLERFTDVELKELYVARMGEDLEEAVMLR